MNMDESEHFVAIHWTIKHQTNVLYYKATTILNMVQHSTIPVASEHMNISNVKYIFCVKYVTCVSQLVKTATLHKTGVHRDMWNFCLNKQTQCIPVEELNNQHTAMVAICHIYGASHSSAGSLNPRYQRSPSWKKFRPATNDWQRLGTPDLESVYHFLR
jgi:hypothetical protein